MLREEWTLVCSLLVAALCACGSPPPPDGGEAGPVAVPTTDNVVSCVCSGLVPMNDTTGCPTAFTGITVFPFTSFPDGGGGPPYGDSGYDGNVGPQNICGRMQTQTVCYPARLNPNNTLPDGGQTDPDASTMVQQIDLEAFCAGEVQTYAEEAARMVYGACDPQVTCHAQLTTGPDGGTAVVTSENSSCNQACPTSVALMVNNNPFTGFTNEPKGTFVAAPNQAACPLSADTAAVCQPSSFDPPGLPPDGLSLSSAGQDSRATVDSGSTATITLGTNSPVTTSIHGGLHIFGVPCPGASCGVGLAVEWTADDFTIGGDSFSSILIDGSGAPPGATLDTTGAGNFAANQFFATVRAHYVSTVSGDAAYYTPNYAPLNLLVDWSAGTVEITMDETIPAGSSTPQIRIQLSVTATIANECPYAASAGADQVLECSSHTTQAVTLSASASDRDGDLMSYVWRADPGGASTLVGYGTTVITSQGLGTKSYGVAIRDTQSQIGGLTHVTIEDTTPPANGTPTYDFGCSIGVPSNIFAQLCALGTYGQNPAVWPVTDICDPSPTPTPDTIYEYNEAGTLVQTVKCGDPYPVPSTDPSHTYDVRWHSVDHSGNSTAEWLARVQLQDANPSSACSTGFGHYTGNVLYSGKLGDAPSVPTPALHVYDFSRASTGAFTLPSGLGFARASSATVQTSASTVVTTGIGANVARVGNDGAGRFGLVLEEARTNLVADSRNMTASSWFAGSSVTTTASATTGPDDGSYTASRSVVASGGYSRYQYFGTLSGTYTASAWIARLSGGGPLQLFDEASPTVGAVSVGSASTTYQRASSRYSFSSSSAYLVPVDARNHTAIGGYIAQAYDNVSDLMQFEEGAFATEAIMTSGGTATRAGEELDQTTGSALLDSGRLSFEAHLQPKGGSADYTGWVGLWYDGTNYAAIWAPINTLYISIGGSTNTVSGISWDAGHELQIFVAAGGGSTTVVQWRDDSGAIHDGTVSGSALSSFSESGSVDLLCVSTTDQFTSHVQQIAFWHNGYKPLWTN